MEDDTPSPDIDNLALYLPLPYRVLLTFILGIWLFALNLHYFHIVRLDVSPMLRYTRGAHEPLLHSSVYQVASTLSLIFAANLIAFWTFTNGNPDLVWRWEIMPLLCFIAITVVFVWPLGGWHRRGRMRFLRMLRRVLLGGLDTDLRFADILLADALTSYSKVLADFGLVLVLYCSGSSSTMIPPDRNISPHLLVPFILALPYLARFRQCLIEYLRAKRKGLPARDTRPHILNALKYASAFPVIVFSALQRNFDDSAEHWVSKPALERGWYLAIAVNSLYSFYWDVSRDWDLTLLSSARSSPEYPFGLRRVRYFETPEFYYGAVVIDFLLRLTWSIKLSPHLDHINKIEGGIFALELLEVFRRWLWVFFRVEKEHVVQRTASIGLSLLDDAESGVMLGEMGKIDED